MTWRSTAEVDEVRISRWRLSAALVGGHLAAAYSFAASMLLFVALTDPSTSLPRSAGGWWALMQAVAFSPLAAAAISLWTVMLMAPASLIASPLTYLAARRLRTGLPTTLAIGAAVGVAEVCVLLASDALLGAPRPSGGPPISALFLVCAAAAGVAYGAVVWALCIRPRLGRFGGARWRGA